LKSPPAFLGGSTLVLLFDTNVLFLSQDGSSILVVVYNSWDATVTRGYSTDHKIRRSSRYGKYHYSEPKYI